MTPFPDNKDHVRKCVICCFKFITNDMDQWYCKKCDPNPPVKTIPIKMPAKKIYFNWDFGKGGGDYSPQPDKTLTPDSEAPIKEYSATVKFFRNIPSITTTATIPIDGRSELEVTDKVYNKYPNILSLDIQQR